jgi:hypothetical protein
VDITAELLGGAIVGTLACLCSGIQKGHSQSPKPIKQKTHGLWPFLLVDGKHKHTAVIDLCALASIVALGQSSGNPGLGTIERLGTVTKPPITFDVGDNVGARAALKVSVAAAIHARSPFS